MITIISDYFQVNQRTLKKKIRNFSLKHTLISRETSQRSLVAVWLLRMIDLQDNQQLANIGLFSLSILILILLFFFNIKAHAGECQGRVLSETKTADGQTHIRKAELSIHEPISESDK